MPKQFLDRSDVRSTLEGVRRKTVAKRVAAGSLGQAPTQHRRPDRFLYCRFINVVPLDS